MLHIIDVSIVCRNEIAREGLKRILLSENISVVGTAADAESLSAVVQETRPERRHIVIVDDPRDDTTQLHALHELFPSAFVVVLADAFDLDAVTAAFGCGIDGYVVKEISCRPLIGSLNLVALGEKVLPSQLARSLAGVSSSISTKPWQQNVPAANLSHREMAILQCLALGLANKIVCRRLNISEATVKVHVKAILRKLRVANRTQAAIWAVKHGVEHPREDKPPVIAAQTAPLQLALGSAH
jgi:two-component system nitrate/nitrite response regulator NarL